LPLLCADMRNVASPFRLSWSPIEFFKPDLDNERVPLEFTLRIAHNISSVKVERISVWEASPAPSRDASQLDIFNEISRLPLSWPGIMDNILTPWRPLAGRAGGSAGG
jgi:hypothetical protein